MQHRSQSAKLCSLKNARLKRYIVSLVRLPMARAPGAKMQSARSCLLENATQITNCKIVLPQKCKIKEIDNFIIKATQGPRAIGANVQGARSCLLKHATQISNCKIVHP